jgi:HlyD family secretion protein
MSRRSLIFLIVGLALMAAIAVAGWMTRAPSVPAVTLRLAPLVRTLQFSGRVATLSRVDVGSTLTGRVLQVNVTQGAQVAMGDVLVRLEDDELQAALAQAKASERQAQARLQGLQSTGRGVTQAALAQADSVLLAAQAELKRTQDLVAKGFLSESRMNESERAAAVAKAQRDSARAQSQANTDQGSEVLQAQAQWALAQAATAAARARLAQTVVLAPANASVLARLVEPGQIVQPGRALLSLALAGPTQLVAQVDERYLEQLKVGQTANVLADAFAQQRFQAKVESIAPLVDSQRGAIEVKFSLLQQAAPDFLREDMTLSIEVETARRESVLVVPLQALQASSPSGSEATVMVEHQGRVQARQVRLGLRTLEAAEVVDGLKPGDVVLKGPAPKPGQRVRAETAAQAVGPSPKPASGDAGSALTNAMGR